MSNNLPATVNDNKWTTRVMRALGPLISLSQEASEKYAEHQMRLAKVEVAKESMLLEVRMYADIKKQLVSLPPENLVSMRLESFCSMPKKATLMWLRLLSVILIASLKSQ